MLSIERRDQIRAWADHDDCNVHWSNAAKDLLNALEAAQAEIQRLREVGNTLRNNVHGALGLDGPAIREVIGNTNYRCIEESIEHWDAALPAPAATEEGERS